MAIFTIRIFLLPFFVRGEKYVLPTRLPSPMLLSNDEICESAGMAMNHEPQFLIVLLLLFKLPIVLEHRVGVRVM